MHRPLRIQQARHAVIRRRDINMLEGSPFVKILLFALPLMAVNLLQSLYNAADMMVVSLSSAPDAVGAVGVTSSYLNLMLNLFIGFSAGANVVAARCNGAQDEQGISRTVHTAICMAGIFGVGAAAVGMLLARPVYTLMGNSGTLLELSLLYSYIYFAGMPFLALTNYASALLHAKGDTRTPFFVLSTTGILNVGLNLFFVLVLDMTVDGVALATSIANVVSAALLLWRLSRAEGGFRFRPRLLRVDRAVFREVVRIGVPAGIQSSMFSISNILIHSSVLQINNAVTPAGAAYAPVIKGSGAAQNIETFAYAGSNAVTNAAITFTSCHVGAQKEKRLPRVMLNYYLSTLLLVAATVLPLWLLRDPLLSLYGIQAVAGDTLSVIAYETAITRMEIILGTFLLVAYMNVAGGVLRGFGFSLTPMLINVVSVCGIRVLWVYTVFRWYPTFAALYLSYPVTWAITFAVMLVIGIVAVKRRIRKHNPVSAETATETGE